MLINERKVIKMAKLQYVADSEPGYERVRKGKGFAYYSDGSLVKDKDLLDRFKSLVIPPAWRDVWICSNKNGHLQVTGIDDKGRKQYLYHPEWIRLQQENKFSKIIDFGKVLPSIRAKIQSDSRKRNLTKDKVIALALEVMEETLIRTGSTHYRDINKSYGLTTLMNKHVQINGSNIRFLFRGKKGVLHEINVNDKKLAKKLQNVKEIPGQHLFQYIDEDDEVYSISSTDINHYIQLCSQDDFSSKDFRTWFGTVWAFIKLSKYAPFKNKAEYEHNIVEMYDFVAQKLGNTRSVCKKYYVSNSLIEAYECGASKPYFERFVSECEKDSLLEHAEKQLLKLLEDHKSV